MTRKQTLSATKAPARDAYGFLLASDGLPQSPHARAKALAEAGKKTDPLELVSATLIANYTAPVTTPITRTEKE